MSAIANIAIQDGQSSPVTHTYKPIESGINAFLRENVTNVPLVAQGNVRLVTKVSQANPVKRKTLILELPVQEVVTGSNAAGYSAAPKIAHVVRMKVELTCHERATSAERKDVRTLIKNALLDAQVISFFDDLETPY